MKYYVAENTGKGFITHEDNEKSRIFAYPGDIWVTENIEWAERVGANEVTKQEAQNVINTIVSSSLLDLENKFNTETDENIKKELQESIDSFNDLINSYVL